MGITEISPTEAILIAISGMLIVFVMLSILSIMIVIISKAVQMKYKSKPTATNPEVKASEFSSPPYGGEVELVDVDEKTAACIMAIVSHETQLPLSELVFKSIKTLK